jgi:hypothetical protein
MGQCTATSGRGTRCRAQAIRGGNVCITHGGAAPQVRAAAVRRLAALVDPAIGVLSKSLKSKSDRIKLDAAKDVLDRNSLSGSNKLELHGNLNVGGDIDTAIGRLLEKLAGRGEVPPALEADGQAEPTDPAG